MQKHNTKEEFLTAAGEQIRWRRARTPLLYELETHILDRRDALAAEGVEDASAEMIAVSEMGDPVAIGAELDRVHRPRPNWLLILCCVSLLSLGMILLWALGGASPQFSRMAIYAGIGIVFMIAGYFLDYTSLARFSFPIFCALCTVCVLFSLGRSAFASTAQQLCYLLPLAYTSLIYSLRSSKRIALISCAALFCVMFVSFLSVSPFSTIVYNIVVCSAALIYFVSKGSFSENKLKLLLISMIPVFIFAFLSLTLSGNLSWRLEGVFNPSSDPLGSGWVPLRVRELLSTSIFFGAGKTSELSEIFLGSSDFSLVEYMLAAVSHKYGYIIFIIVGILLVLSAAAIIFFIKKQSCLFGKTIILTVGCSFLLRAAAYITNNLGFILLSLDGIPMFSYNGKLLVIDMFTMGILLSVFRMENIARDGNTYSRTLIHS